MIKDNHYKVDIISLNYHMTPHEKTELSLFNFLKQRLCGTTRVTFFK